ncbi:MAG: DNA translocase FtsK [bacterium]|nr:DNA translocase FtsK [bacterium]
MARKKKQKKNRKTFGKTRNPGRFSLPMETKRLIWGILLLLIAIILTFSFADKAGIAGKALMRGLFFLIGKTVFIIPLIFVIAGGIFLTTKYKRFLLPVILAILLLILGVSGILGSLNSAQKLVPAKPGVSQGEGGWIGYIFSLSLLKLFGFWVTQIISGALIVIGGLIFWQFFKRPISLKTETEVLEKEPPQPSFIKRIFRPKFKVKEIPPFASKEAIQVESQSGFPELKTKALEPSVISSPAGYQFPPLDLLEADRGEPSSGDIKVNSAIIKKTLQNFDIPVEMSAVNIGPTVTQYTLKPAEGVKLSKITVLSNDISLALAAHPIRIEAPIPGKALVGIEVPNKVRMRVRLRNLFSLPEFQNYPSNLAITLGKDVAGKAVFTDLGKMPHLLVAGATGTGKTIYLNSLILSLLYRNGPEILKFILIDPKRVEFSIYEDFPHLLTPVIYDAQKTVNVLKWLTLEMERRFEVLAEAKTRDVTLYNEAALKRGDHLMPYIILIIDELADLMAARGKEVEVGIVRLAQMARAVGIHLVVATQRPSVEVITGLIKANITSRIAFQVASQIDSRTIIDMAGAEKLLGLGDLLYLSAETAKPRRMQGAYVSSEKEVKRVMEFFKKKGMPTILKNELEENLKAELEKGEIDETGQSAESFFRGEDPLYEEAKRLVIRSRKASASLLQRYLQIGYARAARLIDILEKRGVVGPGEGAKPRQVYIKTEEEEDGWKKV